MHIEEDGVKSEYQERSRKSVSNLRNRHQVPTYSKSFGYGTRVKSRSHSDQVEEHESGPTRRVAILQSRSKSGSESHQLGQRVTRALPSRGI